MIKRTIPDWCHYHGDLNKDNSKRCCCCNADVIYKQLGDGKALHSLCYNCVFGKNIERKDYDKVKNKEKDTILAKNEGVKK